MKLASILAVSIGIALLACSSLETERLIDVGWNKPTSNIPLGRFSEAVTVAQIKETSPVIIVLMELFRN